MKLVIMSHDQLGHTQFIVWSVMLSISFTIINFVFLSDSISLKEKKILFVFNLTINVTQHCIIEVFDLAITSFLSLLCFIL